jgi:hypothetical protein
MRGVAGLFGNILIGYPRLLAGSDLKINRSIFGLVLPFCLSGAWAQNFPTATVTPLAATPLVQVTADFNRDGHADIAYLDVVSPQSLHILLGKGDGTFTAGPIIPLVSGVGANLTVGDINRDGVPDLVIGAAGNSSSLVLTALIGVGDGTFGAPIASPISSVLVEYKVGIGDFDDDGVPDIVYSDGYEYLYFMKGDGNGHFGTPISFPTYDPSKYVGYGMQDIFVFDLNGDGHPDLIGPGGNGLNVLLGQGGGKFSPAVTYSTYNGLHVADFDGDGHVDAISCDNTGTTGYTAANLGTIVVAYGRADGTFGPNIAVSTVPNHEGFVTGITDLHGDGKNRIVVASPDGVSITLGATPGVTESYAGSFAQNLVAFSATNQYLLGDFNEDGYTDIAMPADNALAILYGRSDGTFNGAVSVETDGYIGVASLQLVDVTGDHIPDAVTSTTAIFRGNGDGTFAPLPNYDTWSGGGRLYPADFNGDGNIDFLSGETIYYGDGKGSFTRMVLDGLGNAPAFAPVGYYANGNFNNDGKPDAAASMDSNMAGVNGLSFAISTVTPKIYNYSYFSMTEIPGPLGTGDFNRDHCDDVAAAGETQILILKSDCSGNFTQIGSYTTGYQGSYFSPFSPSYSATDLIVVDLDGDGNLDIVYTISSAKVARILYGNGDGAFKQGVDIDLAYSSNFVTAGDLDGDGNPDLVFSGYGLITIIHGQGDRKFSAPQYLAGGYQTGKPVLADLRLRGRFDIGIPNLGTEGNLTNEQGYSFAIFLNPLPALSPTALNTSLMVAPEPSPYSEPFTATAVFTPANSAHVPTGTATFTLDGGSFTAGALNSSGVATATFPLASVGTHIVAVSYPGDANFTAISTSVHHVVTAITTATALNCSPNPIFIGGTALLAATVTSGNGTPTGSILFTDNGAALGTEGVANGTVSFAYTGTVATTHTITATYTPTGSYAGSSASCTEVVNPLPTTSVLTVAPATITYGSPVTLTATVAAVPPPGPSTPTGTVTFYNGSSGLGTGTLAGGIATLSASNLPGGTYTLTCMYSGSSIYETSNCNSVPVTVNAAATTLTIHSSANPAAALSPVTFTVQLMVGGQTVGAGNAVSLTINGQTASLVTDATGSASTTISTLTPGSYPVAASFAGTSSSLASSASLTEVVNALGDTMAVSAGPNPAYVGQTVTLKAIVDELGTTTPITSGNVTFFDGSTPLGTLALSATGTATYTTSTLSVGTHPITASFVPANTVFLPSTSSALNEVILPSGFTIAVSPTTITLAQGASGTVAIQLGSIGGFAGPLTLSYGPLPLYATATISPATVTLASGGSGSSTLTLNTLLNAENVVPARPGTRELPAVLAAVLLFFVPLGIARRNRIGRLVGLALCAVALGAMTGCTNAWHTENSVAAGTYQVGVTATDVNHNSQTATLTVVVTP